MPYERILVADDMITGLDITKGLLKPCSMHIDCMSRGIEAINAIGMEKRIERFYDDGKTYFIIAQNEPFLNAPWKLVTKIDEICFKLSTDNPKPKKNKPDRKLLDRMLEACMNYETDSADSVIG